MLKTKKALPVSEGLLFYFEPVTLLPHHLDFSHHALAAALNIQHI